MCSSMGSCLMTTALAVCSGSGERRSLDELLVALVRFYYRRTDKWEILMNCSHKFKMFYIPFSLSCCCCCEPLSGAVNFPFDQKAEIIIIFNLAIVNKLRHCLETYFILNKTLKQTSHWKDFSCRWMAETCFFKTSPCANSFDKSWTNKVDIFKWKCTKLRFSSN